MSIRGEVMSEKTVGDPINPNHFKDHPSGVECITITEHMNFCLGNAMKYIWRAGRKPGASKYQDLAKAKWYVEREMALEMKRIEDEEKASAKKEIKTECSGHGRGGTVECCPRAGEYNGFGSDGPLKFHCPKSCSCHD